jgi:hypothetical protein
MLSQVRQHHLAARGIVPFRLVESAYKNAFPNKNKSTATHCLQEQKEKDIPFNGSTQKPSNTSNINQRQFVGDNRNIDSYFLPVHSITI